jgi:hypothetical protein
LKESSKLDIKTLGYEKRYLQFHLKQIMRAVHKRYPMEGTDLQDCKKKSKFSENISS